MITFEDGLQIKLADVVATQAFASAISKVLLPGLCIYLHGGLGAGKTTLVRAMLQSLGHDGVIKSPTYTLVESYAIVGLQIYHFDLYRLADPAELEFIGIKDYVSDTSICIFEWADKGIGFIPQADIEITLDFANDSRQSARIATLNANTAKGLKTLQAMTIGQ